MNKIWIIGKRELKTYFDSLVAYILIALFLGITGLITWFGIVRADVFFRAQADMLVFFSVTQWVLFLLIPGITMKMFAEENKTGTIEILLTKAVTDWQVVLGKFLGSLMLFLIALSFTLPYYFTIWWLGPIDHGSVLSGYFGLILMSAAYIGIGLFASSITNNQIVAFLLTVAAMLLFHLILFLLAAEATGFVALLFNYLSTYTHLEALTRGVIDTKDVIFFVSITLLGLVLSESMLSKRNLPD